MSKWKNSLLNELTNVIMGQSPPSSTYNSEGLGLPFLQGCADFGAHYPLTKTYCSKPQKIAPKDSLLISVRAPVGDTNRANMDYAIGRGLAAVVATRIDPNFLEYVVQHQISVLEKVSQGSTFLAINTDDLKTLCLFTPSSITEQRKIARILSIVDAVIEKTEITIAKYKAIKQGMMQDIFTRGLDKSGKLRPSYQDAPELYNKTKLGWIPKEWEVVKIGDCCSDFINGGTPSTKNPDNWAGTIPWITGADFLDSFEIGFIRRFITLDAVRNSSTHVIKGGNIILVTRTGVGKLAIAPFDITISQDITGVILNDEMFLVNYFFYYLQLLVEDFKKVNQGTSINGIVRNDLENTLVMKPKIEEQDKIAKMLSAIDLEIATEVQALNKTQRLRLALMSILLTGKVRVKYKEKSGVVDGSEY